MTDFGPALARSDPASDPFYRTLGELQAESERVSDYRELVELAIRRQYWSSRRWLVQWFRLRFMPSGRAWRKDCREWHGRVLIGGASHWCGDWDDLPIDETLDEFASCHCEEYQ